MVIEVLNNGFTTLSDLLTVTGTATLGGTLVIGFVASSLGLVTENFIPFDFSGTIAGSFDRVIDAGGNILFIDVTGGIFTILGVNPNVPDEIVEELIGFIEDREEVQEMIQDNKSAPEEAIEAIQEEEEEDDGSLLVCK